VTDRDGDGKFDLLLNSSNADLLRQNRQIRRSAGLVLPVENFHLPVALTATGSCRTRGLWPTETLKATMSVRRLSTSTAMECLIFWAVRKTEGFTFCKTRAAEDTLRRLPQVRRASEWNTGGHSLALRACHARQTNCRAISSSSSVRSFGRISSYGNAPTLSFPRFRLT